MKPLTMKTLFLCLYAMVAALSINAQQEIRSDKYKLAFTAPETLKFFQGDSETFFGYESDNYGVSIDVVPVERESKKFMEDLSYGAKEIAKDMGFSKSFGIGNIPDISESYYVTAIMKDQFGGVPVYVLAILDSSKQTAFEICVYCYNLNMNAGEEIVNSFKFFDWGGKQWAVGFNQ